jgi:rhodanese-related sulfurtransferase
MNRKTLTFLAFLLCFALSCVHSGAVKATDVPRMAMEELKNLLGKPGVVIIDVRASSDWDASDSKIQGAVREDPKRVGSWLETYPKEKTLIFYCA